MTIVETRAITGGVDTHADVHVAAALDPIGGLLGVREFAATTAGYTGLLGWLAGFGTVCLVGIEGTGSYGAGLARHVTAAGVGVVEVDRSDRQDRRRSGQVRPSRRGQRRPGRPVRQGVGRAQGPRWQRRGDPRADGRQAQRPLRADQTHQPGRALILTGPEDLRARFAQHTVAALVAETAALRPRPGDVVGYATRVALRELGRRAQFLDGQLDRLDALIAPLVTAHAPEPARPATGSAPTPPRMLLIAAGDHPERLRSEAAWAHLCGAAPIPASSGKIVRHRLNPAGDRQANHALWRIVFTRMSSDPAHPRLRRAPHQGRALQARDHPLPQALRRPRGLPAPPHARRLTQPTPGAA